MSHLTEVQLVQHDASNEIIVGAKAMTTKRKILLILVLIVTNIKTLALSILDFSTDMALVILYGSLMTQIYEFTTLATLFPEFSQSERWDEILDEVRSFKNWFGMTSQQLFYYTLAPIVLPMVLNFVECLEFIFSKKIEQMFSKRMGFFVKALMLIGFPLLPIIFIFLEAVHRYLKKTSRNGHDVTKATEAVETLRRLYGRAELVEALAEAGIQPLLQVFIILRAPTFFNFSSGFNDDSLKGHFNFELSKLLLLPQFFSLVTSVVSIALTYTLNYNRRLGTKMSIEAQGVYFSHVISAVISRITCFTLFALSCFHYNNDSHNPFPYIYLTIGLHISIIIVSSFFFKKCDEIEEQQLQHQWYKQIPLTMKNCVLDGLATIYVPFVTDEKAKVDIKRHLFVYLLITIENLVMTGLAVYWIVNHTDDKFWMKSEMTKILIIIWAGYGISLILDVIFSTLLHPSTVDPSPKKNTNVEKFISASLKMLAQILMIIIVNGILVSCVFYGPWAIIKTNLSQTEIIFWTLVPICLATGFYMIECINFIR